MNSQLETALEDLHRSTGTICDIGLEDMGAIRAALERRAEAIAKLALVLEQTEVLEASAADRLAEALALGERAARRALRMRFDAIEEWTRLHQIRRGLGQASAESGQAVDVTG